MIEIVMTLTETYFVPNFLIRKMNHEDTNFLLKLYCKLSRFPIYKGCTIVGLYISSPEADIHEASFEDSHMAVFFVFFIC